MADGETIVIAKAGRPVARLMPLEVTSDAAVADYPGNIELV